MVGSCSIMFVYVFACKNVSIVFQRCDISAYKFKEKWLMQVLIPLFFRFSFG